MVERHFTILGLFIAQLSSGYWQESKGDDCKREGGFPDWRAKSGIWLGVNIPYRNPERRDIRDYFGCFGHFLEQKFETGVTLLRNLEKRCLAPALLNQHRGWLQAIS
jgi:hypothetical protein